MGTRWEQVARATNGEDYAAAYVERFRELAADGQDVHGEAALVCSLLPAPARVLDAGCGTGRITVRLTELGYSVVGVDVDDSMLAQARRAAPSLDWRHADLAALDLGPDRGDRFDLVLLAGNIVPLLEPGTLGDSCRRIAAHLAPDGLVVCGFGLDADHLPPGCPVTDLAELDAAMALAGLAPASRLGSWQGAAHDPGQGYVVTVHARPAAGSSR